MLLLVLLMCGEEEKKKRSKSNERKSCKQISCPLHLISLYYLHKSHVKSVPRSLTNQNCAHFLLLHLQQGGKEKKYSTTTTKRCNRVTIEILKTAAKFFFNGTDERKRKI